MADKKTTAVSKGTLLKRFLEDKDAKKVTAAKKAHRTFKRACNSRITDLTDRNEDLQEQADVLTGHICDGTTAPSKENFSRLVTLGQDQDLNSRDLKDSIALFKEMFGEDPKSFD